MDTGEFPSNNSQAGIAGTPTDINGKYVTQVEVGDVADGVITVTYGNDANALIGGDTLDLSPTTNAGSVEWACSSGDLADKHLPAACR